MCDWIVCCEASNGQPKAYNRTSKAFVCEFLPDCVAKARDNIHIGLPLLLEVLVQLVDDLQRVDVKIFEQKDQWGHEET